MSLDRIEKFNYLKGCLQEAALSTICDLEVTELNYVKALAKLKERFDNKNLMFQEHITNIFEMSKVSKPCPIQIRALIDSISAHLSAMLSLGNYENIVNAILIRFAIDRLDYDSRLKWDESIDFDKLSSWTDFSSIIVRRCQALEARKSSEVYAPERPSSQQEKGNRFRSKPKRNVQSAFAISSSGTLCAFCKNAHSIDSCSSFLKLSARERFNQAKLLGLCIKCLTKGHSVRQCVQRNCEVCDQPHHSKLHRFVVSPACLQQSSLEATSSSGIASPPASLVGTSVNEASSYTFLATAILNIRDRSGLWQPIRALLDSASQLNIITQSAAHRLNLKQEPVNAAASGLGMSTESYKHRTNTIIGSRVNNFVESIQLAVLKSITGFQPNQKIDIVDWNLPNNIDMADPYFNQPNRIDILLGAETFFKILSIGQIKLGNEYPCLQKTLLGWIVAGRYQECHNSQRYCLLASNSPESRVTDEDLHNLVEKFWKMESIGTKSDSLNAEEAFCEDLFQKTTCGLSDGSFMVRLPFKDNVSSLGESFSSAHKRFLCLERRLKKDPILREQYAAFLSEYESLGHMIALSPQQINEVKYYTPHQCVLRPDSSSTKLRVVFDGSCKTSTNLSLNDTLMVGPTIQDDLYNIVLRFRFHRYALTADISKMYRQVQVTEDDSFYQCILWRPQPTEDIVTYRLKTITYGTASAPYLATRCLQQIAKDHQHTNPRAARVILKDFYVDDLITGADTKKDVEFIRNGVDAILKSANFILRKWYSNDLSILQGLPEENMEKPLRINDSDVIKTLGLVWHPKRDTFGFISQPYKSIGKISKRSVLSDLSRLFDPLGLINPIVVRAKMFMQELWRSRLDWDESLPMEMHDRWTKYMHDLEHLSHIDIPRYVFMNTSINCMELHGFSDASMRAFGACVYVRSEDVAGNICVRLITAKSKVAPLSTQSLPRLELCGALLLAELMDRVTNNIDSVIQGLQNSPGVYLWTDSEVVLDWLSVDSSHWNTFVANRVSKIQELTSSSQWLHVNSKDNPADIISRGSKVSELAESIWFTGPNFLRGPRELWPIQKKTCNKNGFRKKTHTNSLAHFI